MIRRGGDLRRALSKPIRLSIVFEKLDCNVLMAPSCFRNHQEMDLIGEAGDVGLPFLSMRERTGSLARCIQIR